MEPYNNNKISKLKIAIYHPLGAKVAKQESSSIETFLASGTHDEFCAEYIEKADWLFFLLKGSYIEDTNLLTDIIDELEGGVAMYFNYFIRLEKQKILSCFDTYNKGRFRSSQQIIQAPVLVESKYLKDFKFNKNLIDLQNFQLIRYLTDKCMLKRSKHIIDGVLPIQLNVEHDIKMLNEQSHT